MAVPARPLAGALLDSAWGGLVHDAVVAQDIQSGTTTLVWSASALSAVVAVTFARPFAAVPVVVVASTQPAYTAALTAVPTAAGCSLQGRRGDGTSASGSVPAPWLAYGPRA